MDLTVKAAAAGAISAAALALSAPAATAAIPRNPMSAPTCANQQVVFVPGGANTIPSAPSDVPHGLITGQMGVKLGLQPDTNATFVGYQAFPFAVSKYSDSSNEGYNRTAAKIQQIQNDCPNSKISLVGYSEGADISARIINDAAHGRGPLDKDRFASAALYANPYQGGNGAAQYHDDMSNATGALGHLDGGYGELGADVLEVCNPQDIICNYPQEYLGLVSPSMEVDAVHGKLPLQQIVGEAAQHGPMDNINLLRGQLAHLQYGGAEFQAGIDWINNH